MFETGPLYDRMLGCQSRIIVNQGGTSSAKTYTTLQILFTKAVSEPDTVITVVGESVPNLKKGAIRDAQHIVSSSEVLQSKIADYNKAERTYTFTSGARMEFTSYQTAQDAKSGKRQYLFINEANGISYEIYKQLFLRTYAQTFIDYNPDRAFWVHDHIIHRQDCTLFITDHRHNPFLSDETRREIERLKTEDYELWKVYARGLTGKIRGLVLPKFAKCAAIPDGAKLIGRGLDFGYVADPTACYELYQYRGDLYVNELIYERGLKNPQIAKRLLDLGLTDRDEIIADSAEKKSIDEINDFGLWLTPATKGPDSIAFGLDILQRFTIYATENSTGILSEQPRYVYRKDKNGNMTNEPVDAYNHAIDAVRYCAMHKLGHVVEKRKHSFAAAA